MIRDDQPRQQSDEESGFPKSAQNWRGDYSEQVEFFRNGARAQHTPAEPREFGKKRERIQGLFAELRELRKSAQN
jgi:hypothetical protein